MKKILSFTTYLICFLIIKANASIISSYDIIDANISGTGGWSHTYDGLITPTSGSLANYSGGSGTLNDGIIVDPSVNNQLWFNNSNNPSITLHLDNLYEINSISLFSADGSTSNGIPGSITSLDVTINNTILNFSTSVLNQVDEFIDFTGSAFAGINTNTIILSNFSTATFNIVEIEIDANINTIPILPSFWLLGFGLVGLRSKYLN